MGTFSIKDIQWGATFKLNIIRAFIAGVVWTIIFYALGMEKPPGMPGLWLYIIIWPLGYLLFFLPLGLIAGFLNRIGIPFVGLLTFIPALMVIPADPIMFILHKATPNLVPVESYRFIDPAVSIRVYESGMPAEEVMVSKDAETTSSNISSCSFAGRIVVDKDTKVGGFSWPSQATAFEIHKDWSVSTPSDRDFGWIDVNGEIHKGKPFWQIDPNATLSGGNTGIKIHGDNCYVKNNNIGELVR